MEQKPRRKRRPTTDIGGERYIRAHRCRSLRAARVREKEYTTKGEKVKIRKEGMMYEVWTTY